MEDKVMVAASIVWLSICFVFNLIAAGMCIENWSKWELFAYKIADAIACGCIIYTLWTCCK